MDAEKEGTVSLGDCINYDAETQWLEKAIRIGVERTVTGLVLGSTESVIPLRRPRGDIQWARNSSALEINIWEPSVNQ